MLALLSVWVGLLSLLVAASMAIHRPFFTDMNVVGVLWFESPAALCFGGLILWAYRKEDFSDPAIQAQRLQAKVGMTMAILAAAIVYFLIIYSQKLVPLVPSTASIL